MRKRRSAAFIIAIGDVAALYCALGITLLIRYGATLSKPWEIHNFPFGVVFSVWILLFFIAGLYEREAWSANRVIKERILRTIAVAGVVAVVLFYLVPSFIITPKTNLLIQIVISSGLIIGWRMLASSILRITAKTNVLFVGFSNEVRAVMEIIIQNPQVGYRISALIAPERALPIPHGVRILPPNADLAHFVKQENIAMVIASKDIRSNKEFVRVLYHILPLGIRFVDFPTFFETITGKIPVSLISEVWFLENVSEREKRIFEVIKRSYDMIFAFFIGLLTLLLIPFIAAAITVESDGPILIRQKRTGKNGIPFTLYKFRSMIATGPGGMAETGTPQWARANDKRITRVGSFLRKTRLDEIPQLINIFNGDMSFIGPRPERPEIITILKQQIPFYDIRHMVRPGLSGWAQINFPYGASVEDTMQKLQYDLYYIKNRSIALDLNIALKTIVVILSHEGR